MLVDCSMRLVDTKVDGIPRTQCRDTVSRMIFYRNSVFFASAEADLDLLNNEVTKQEL